MPTELGPRYEVTWRGRPPHMLDEDIPVWYRFLDHFAYQFDRIYYDVRVGGPDPATFHDDIKWGLLFYRLTAKRIDALAEKANELWLIEVAVRPGLRAVGQVMSYFTLWFLDPKIDKPVIPWLVCEQIEPDLAFSLKAQGIGYLTV